jgi:predicted nucleotidyltransferase
MQYMYTPTLKVGKIADVLPCVCVQQVSELALFGSYARDSDVSCRERASENATYVHIAAEDSSHRSGDDLVRCAAVQCSWP